MFTIVYSSRTLAFPTAGHREKDYEKAVVCPHFDHICRPGTIPSRDRWRSPMFP